MELFGLTDDEGLFVYLSDGGHFENLGIYEMLRRRCRTIVAVDAGADPNFEFEDLGNAVRKARIDFGAEIEFTQLFSSSPNHNGARLRLINRPAKPVSAPYCAIGRVRYSPISGENGNLLHDEGTLIYVKAAIHGNESEDILTMRQVTKHFHMKPRSISSSANRNSRATAVSAFTLGWLYFAGSTRIALIRMNLRS